MLKIENKLIDFIKKNIVFILMIIATLLGLLLRGSGIYVESDDFRIWLDLWFSEISNLGVQSLGKQVGNYNISYQMIILLISKVPIFSPLFKYKMVSMVFDFVLSVSSALLVYEITNHSKIRACFTYIIVFCSLNVVFNSAYWAQCDSIYCSFIVLGLYFLIKEKNTAAFLMFGISFAFKLQMVFILPFLLLYWFIRQKYSLLHFLLIPLVNIVFFIPTLFFGRPISDIYSVYINQMQEYSRIQMNAPNIYAILLSYNRGRCSYLYYSGASFKWLGIALTFLILISVFVFMIIRNFDLTDKENTMAVLIWSLWTIFMFLPFMHDRYGYLLDIMLIITSIVFYQKLYWVFAVVCNASSINTTCFFLFGSDVISLKVVALIYTSFYLLFTVILVYRILGIDFRQLLQYNRVQSE